MLFYTNIKPADMVPCPRELPMQLMHGLVSVRGLDCVVLFAVRPGVALQAHNGRNIRVAGICEANAPRQFVMHNIQDWVRAHDLANMGSAPKQSPELTDYEKTHMAQPNTCGRRPPFRH